MDNGITPNTPATLVPHILQPVAMSYPTEKEQAHLRDYWEVIRKRKWWVIGVFLGIMALIIGVILFMTPIYMVTTTLQIIQDNPSAIMGGGATDPLGALTGTSEIDRFYETQNNILYSRPIALSLIKTLNLKKHPDYIQMQADYPKKSPEEVESDFADYMLDNLKIEPVKNSFLVNVSYKSTDKYLAYQVANAVQKEYLNILMNTRQQSYSMITEWLQRELQNLADKLQVSEKALYKSGQKSDFMGLEDNNNLSNVVYVKYVELYHLLTTAQADVANKEAQYKQIKEKGADAPLIVNNPLVQNLRTEFVKQKANVASIERLYGRNYPTLQVESSRIKELNSKLNAEVDRIKTSVKADYEASKKAENLVKKELVKQKSSVANLQTDLVDHHIISRDFLTYKTLYEGLLGRMKDASIAATMVASNVSVITPPYLPFKPWLPKPLLFIAVGVVLGLFLGVGIAFLVEYFDNSIKSTDEFEKVCHIPLLGVVPHYAESRKMDQKEIDAAEMELVTYNQPRSVVSESFFQIRTSLMLSSSGGAPKIFAVTSANPNEGKSTISVNLGLALAVTGRHVLLIDTDLRKPTLHKFFSMDVQPGLTNYLTGEATLADIIRPTVSPNLFIITAGSIPPSPVELLTSEAMVEVVSELKKQFQHIIIDSPPIIGFADVRAVAPLVDSVVLVLKHHFTSRDAAKLSVKLLNQVNVRVLGGILNMVRKDRMGYGGYYSYYKYYGKYYDNYNEANKDSS